jgi:hypothetical protein
MTMWFGLTLSALYSDWWSSCQSGLSICVDSIVSFGGCGLDRPLRGYAIGPIGLIHLFRCGRGMTGHALGARGPVMPVWHVSHASGTKEMA